MAVTININGLSLVHKDSGGKAQCTLPDVCKTPPGPIPVPYQNIAFSKDLAKGTKTVEVDGGNMAANFGSEFSVSIGDEPGVAGGIISGTNLKEATWITFSFDVFLEGKGACRRTDKMWMNHANTVCAAGVQNPALEQFKKIICPIICEVAESIRKGEKLPEGKSTWTQVINDKLKKHADELAKLGVRMEKSVIVAALKGSASKWGRKALKRFGIKGLLKKGGANIIPVIGQGISIALTVVDVGMTVVDTARLAADAYEMLRFRPDFMIQSGGDTLVGDIKLEATGDYMRPGQQEALDAMNDGKKTPVLSETTCDCK